MLPLFRSLRARLLLSFFLIFISLSLSLGIVAVALRENGFRAGFGPGESPDINQAIDFARGSYLIGLALGLLAAGVASWVMTRRVVEGLEQVGEQVEVMAAEGFSAGDIEPITVDEAFEGDEIAAMVMRLNELLERVEQGYREQERFIQDASHELKTPIAVLRSEAQVLRTGQPEPGELTAFVLSVEEETERLSELMESLLRLTRTEEKMGLVRSRPHAINDVVMCAIDQCRGMARRRGAAFKVDLLMLIDEDGEPSPERARVAGDFMLLVSMISNFIRNALKYTDSGGTVTIAVVEELAELAVQVSDEGPGLPEDQLELIFERFRSGAPGKRGERGTGLGLSIARSIADLHHGRLAAENLSVGSRFTAYLPRLPSPVKGED